MQFIPNNNIDIPFLEKKWQENAVANTDSSKEENRKILTSLIKDVFCSNEQLFTFMNDVKIRSDGGWFKKSPGALASLVLKKQPEETEIAKIFENHRGNIKNFFNNQGKTLLTPHPTFGDFLELNLIEGGAKKEDKTEFEKNNQEFLNFLKEQQAKHPEEEGLFNHLAQEHHNCQKRLNKGYGYLADILTANIFGESIFHGKNYSGRNIGGHFAADPCWAFLEGLKNYYNSIQDSLSPAEHEKFKELIEAYHTFYLSTLIRMKIGTLKLDSSIEKDKMLNQYSKLGAQILMQDISDVQSGKKNRGYWVAGFEKHFVPLRYEKREDGRFVVGTFNLGEGSDADIMDILLKRKVAAETRIDPTIFDSKEKTQQFCENLTGLWFSSEKEWRNFVNSFSEQKASLKNRVQAESPDMPKPSVPTPSQGIQPEPQKNQAESSDISKPSAPPKSRQIRPMPRRSPDIPKPSIPTPSQGIQPESQKNQAESPDVPNREPQKIQRESTYVAKKHMQTMGDCTCKGQKALLMKEFHQLFADNPNVSYKDFKIFFQHEHLLKLEPQYKYSISLDMDSYRNIKTLNKAQLYEICWAHYHKLSLKDLNSIKEQAKLLSEEEKWKAVCLNFSVENNDFKPINFSLESLFGDSDTVIIEREPDLENSIIQNSKCYRIPNIFKNEKDYESFSQIGLILTKNKEGKITITVNQESIPTIVKTKDGKEVVYNKGDQFVITPDIHSIQMNNFIMNLSFMA